MTKKPLILIGDSAFAEVACEYFTHESDYEVVAFAVEQAFLKRDRLFDRPVVAFETVQERYAPEAHAFFAATVYTDSNRLRTRLYRDAKQKGYAPASFLSRHAFLWRNCRVGEHCFVFEHNVVQPFAQIGDNVILWSGNHIGHHSSIGSHSFLSSHVVVSGFVRIGESCFMGVNSTVANNVTIGDGCTIGAGALILSDVPDGQVAVGIWKKRS